MKIEKYSFKQTDTHTEEVNTTLSELYSVMPQIAKRTIKDWVLSGGKEIIKGGKIVLYTKK